MSKESLQFRCPCCGMHSPIEVLTSEEQFKFAVFRRVLGGKIARSDAEKILLKGSKDKPKQGSGHGRIGYQEANLGRDIYLDRMIARVRTVERELERIRSESST
jgi:hypothetical protein